MVGIPHSFGRTYAALWVVRILFALHSTGYIHPDEHMQNAEITAADILGYYTFRSWEWDPTFPLRAVIPVYMTTGLPFLVAQKLYSALSDQILPPTTLFRLERLSFLCLSSLLDISVALLVPPPMCSFALLLLSSSYVTHAFYIRPFSNSLESVIAALCLVFLNNIVELGSSDSHDTAKSGRAALHWNLHALCILGAFGTSMRPTFFSFALPISFQVLRYSYRAAGSISRTGTLLALPLCSGILTVLCFTVADALYYRGTPFHPVFPCLNFLRYNSSSDNLAEHGLHPRWLHLLVNLPMLLGPSVWFLTISNIYHSFKDSGHGRVGRTRALDVTRETISQIIVLSLAVLSAVPHQEPRFLCPIVLPAIVLVAISSRWPRKAFWVTWIVFNFVFAAVFGVMHQGGVVPSLLYLNTRMTANVSTSTHIVYWKTYMPPRRFLGIPQQDVQSGKVAVVDLAGAAESTLVNTLSSARSETVYVVTPVAMLKSLPGHVASCFTSQKRIFPHLDLDHIRESFEVGWYDGLTLGVYTVEQSCIASAT
ncbi:glycosyltransferase family 22 protein [Pisolithus microcarpus]|nr:glycosyltransferase family 22 protein [Pisolithus microcarpus]